jgi:phosphate transport system permease protein
MPVKEMLSLKFGEGSKAGIAWIWVCGGALVTILGLIVCLFSFVLFQGLSAFWPQNIIQTSSGYGVFHREENKLSNKPKSTIVFLGNRDFSSPEFIQLNENDSNLIKLKDKNESNDIWFVERSEWGVFIGEISSIIDKNLPPKENPTHNDVLATIQNATNASYALNNFMETKINPINTNLESLRISQKKWLRLNPHKNPSKSPEFKSIEEEIIKYTSVHSQNSEQLQKLREDINQTKLILKSFDGQMKEYPAANVVRAFHPNKLNFFQKTHIFFSRIFEFVTQKPREANTAGGVFPAIFGTVSLTFLMILFVMPLGVFTAIYMREISKQGFFVSLVRVAVGNLAGVPSIVFGVFGLGFFCYTVGTSIDALLFQDKLPTPTFGTGGWIWASLTLSLLTVPIVIVSTEEALASVPRSIREASYGCGSTRFQTIFNIVLPQAAPGILTGLVLAMARGVGEVAPLLLTGVVKLAPTLPIDSQFPFIHLERSFMHLGFHIYDLGFQSRSTELSRPMVFATTLLLLGIVFSLNFVAFKMRTKLRKRFEGRGAF